jgi:RNA polymerase sigma-70 factor, ECF subfamily
MGLGLALTDTVEAEYERAYARHARDVFRFLLAWTNDWGAAEDLTQEAFLRLWQHRHAIDWERPVIAWLLVAARRLATSRFRSLRRLAARQSPRSADVDEATVARWLDARDAMAALSPLERTAIVMTAVEGWTFAEAADILQTTEGALRAAVSRARAKLEAA